MRGLIFVTLLLGIEAQQSPLYHYHSWLYATPWRPLVPVPVPVPEPVPMPSPSLDTQQLSLGYTGPQTFPSAAEQAASPALAKRSPILLGILRPAAAAAAAAAAAQEQFTLPFRPSPFAGYSNDRQQDRQQKQPAQPEPLFYAPGYPPAAAGSKPTEEATGKAQLTQPVEDRDQDEDEDQPQPQQHQYLYMSPVNLYYLIRSLAPAQSQ